MNVLQQLKKRQVKDKNGNVKEYLGKPKFIANPVTPGYSGTEKKAAKNKKGEDIVINAYRINPKAKERDVGKKIKSTIKNKKIKKEKING